MKSATAIAVGLLAILLSLDMLKPADSTGEDLSSYMDLEMSQYLRTLLQEAEESGRPLLGGEMNFLPPNMSGFASSIIIFYDTSSSPVVDLSRTLDFNLSAIGLSKKIVAANLVLKQNATAPSYTVSLHEVTRESSTGEESDVELNLLDAGEYSGQWHTLHVQNAVDSIDTSSGRRNYKFILSASSGNNATTSDVLRSVKPMLLVYTSDAANEIISTPGRTPIPLPPTRTGDEALPSAPPPPPSSGFNRDVPSGDSKRKQQERRRQRTRRSLSEDTSQPCAKHEINMSFSQLGWPGDSYSVLFPSPPQEAKVTYCAGTCTRPLALQEREKYNNHGIMLSLALPNIVQGGVAPCCVPLNYTTPVQVVYRSTRPGFNAVDSLPVIDRCVCR